MRSVRLQFEADDGLLSGMRRQWVREAANWSAGCSGPPPNNRSDGCGWRRSVWAKRSQYSRPPKAKPGGRSDWTMRGRLCIGRRGIDNSGTPFCRIGTGNDEHIIFILYPRPLLQGAIIDWECSLVANVASMPLVFGNTLRSRVAAAPTATQVRLPVSAGSHVVHRSGL